MGAAREVSCRIRATHPVLLGVAAQGGTTAVVSGHSVSASVAQRGGSTAVAGGLTARERLEVLPGVRISIQPRSDYTLSTLAGSGRPDRLGFGWNR